MNLLVLGAGGGVGGEVVKQALERGHSLRTLMRPGREVEFEESVHVVVGDLFAPDELDPVMEGADAVVSTIGMQRKNPKNPWSSSISSKTLTSDCARAITASMKRTGVKRVVALSAAGVGDSASKLNMAMDFILATTMIGDAYADLFRMEEIYRGSGLDWLCPRPTRLVPGRRTEDVRIVERFGTAAAISRADVAYWILEALDQRDWPGPFWETLTPQISG